MMLRPFLQIGSWWRSARLMMPREAEVSPDGGLGPLPYIDTGGRDVHTVFIHCSGSDHPKHDDVDVIRRWHLARGWRDIGYHFFITKSLAVQTGRPLSMTPAAQKGHNDGTIAICCSGLRRFTAGQMVLLRNLCEHIERSLIKRLRHRGHCEVSRKRCPVFDYRAVLFLDNNGHMGKAEHVS